MTRHGAGGSGGSGGSGGIGIHRNTWRLRRRELHLMSLEQGGFDGHRAAVQDDHDTDMDDDGLY